MTPLRSAVTVTLAVAAGLLAATGAASAQTTSPLSAARYTVFDTGYTLSIPLDDGGTAADVAKLRAFCETIDVTDPLLAVQREGCLLGIDLNDDGMATADCSSRAGCLRATRSFRVKVTKAIRVLRKSNRVLDAALPAGACRTALRAGRDDIHSTELVRDGLVLVERGLRSRSVKTIKRGQRLIDAGDRLSNKVPSQARQRKTFRAACGPPPAPTAA